MQKLLFLRRSHGVSKKGKDYDMTEVSNGLSSFTLTNAAGVGEQLDTLQEGDEFQAEVHVDVVYGSLRGKIMSVEV